MTLFAMDFFCGAGGLTRGLQDAGIKVIFGLDKDDKCKEPYQYNNPSTAFLQADMREITLKVLQRHARGKRLDRMLFAACAPCQPFSSHLKGNRSGRDATLLGEFGRLIVEAMPAFILVENVPGIARVGGNSTFRRFLHALDSSGYCYDYGILDAKRFGVPQNRRRLILLAMRGGRISLPEPKYGPGLVPYRTVRQAISHFPPISAGESDRDVPNHVTCSISPFNLERLRHTPHDGGDRRSWPKSLGLDCHSGGYAGHTDVYGRMFWDAPAPTLTGRCHSISNGRYGHPTQDRAISLREAAALQSFPDDYLFFGSRKQIALQIGNALPVRLGEALGRHILNSRSSSVL